MGFFTVSNLLTLGIAFFGLFLYHQLTKRNQPQEKVNKYTDQIKEELAAFVSEREAAVRDYAIELDVQQKAAKELMRHLLMTDEDLAKKAAAIAKIDERLNNYDVSLEELVRMTSRVQENLNRVRDESAFVENAVKRVSQAEDKLEEVEQGLAEIEDRFERSNAETMEKVLDDMVISVRTMISDLEAAAETIERRVADHREAVETLERRRESAMTRDMAIINNALQGALDHAGSQADQLEEAAAIKLRDQALERIDRFQAALEEKISAYQDTAQKQADTMQGLAASLKNGWKAEQSALEEQYQTLRAAWKQEFTELTMTAQGLR